MKTLKTMIGMVGLMVGMVMADTPQLNQKQEKTLRAAQVDSVKAQERHTRLLMKTYKANRAIAKARAKIEVLATTYKKEIGCVECTIGEDLTVTRPTPNPLPAPGTN